MSKHESKLTSVKYVVRDFTGEVFNMDKDILKGVAETLKIPFSDGGGDEQILGEIERLQNKDENARLPRPVYRALKKAIEVHTDRMPHYGCTVNH